MSGLSPVKLHRLARPTMHLDTLFDTSSITALLSCCFLTELYAGPKPVSPAGAAAPSTAQPAAVSTAAEAHAGRSSTPEPHVPTQKELLAASLFGEGTSSRPARQKRPHPAAPPRPSPPAQPASAQPAAAQPAAADLLLQLDSPTHAAAPAAASSLGQHTVLCS